MQIRPGVRRLGIALMDVAARHPSGLWVTYEAGQDPRVLRDALGCYSTGVILATANDSEGVPVGLTANSFTSVSLDPPLLLFCLAKSPSRLKTFESTDFFAINVLHAGQQQIASHFAKRGAIRFGEGRCERGISGLPIIADSLAVFECARYSRHDAGDHVIFVGLIERARFTENGEPLVYYQGKFRPIEFGKFD
ncbi:MAG: flavin reductase family protein [Alphaproteobacteria bacterium]|nr:flavin reductase family protein [Alphaproteobacteria bacterium]